jgi:hypothetical protein
MVYSGVPNLKYSKVCSNSVYPKINHDFLLALQSVFSTSRKGTCTKNKLRILEITQKPNVAFAPKEFHFNFLLLSNLMMVGILWGLFFISHSNKTYTIPSKYISFCVAATNFSGRISICWKSEVQYNLDSCHNNRFRS